MASGEQMRAMGLEAAVQLQLAALALRLPNRMIWDWLRACAPDLDAGPAAWDAALAQWPIDPPAKAALRCRMRSETVQAVAKRAAAAGHSAGVSLLAPWMPVYPAFLGELHSPPVFLYAIGDVGLLRRPVSATVIGSRRPSTYGRRVTGSLVRSWSAMGVIIVSGLAAGIDGEAHRAALDIGGRTVAVLGCGPDVVYPTAHADLHRRIGAHGLLISEYPPGTPPRRQHFPARNRLLSALSAAVVVSEAARRSGTMITTDFALDLGLPVLAVPGPVDAPLSQGTNRLLRDGCAVLLEAADLLPYLDTDALIQPACGKSNASQTPHDPGGAEPAAGAMRTILNVLKYTALPLHVLQEQAELSPETFFYGLTELELMGQIEKHAGLYHRMR